MKILGFSGFHNSVQIKRQFFPNLDPVYDRIAQGFDSAAALVCDGKVVAAAAEERFSGQKSTNAFPINAIRFCLDTAGIGVDDLDFVAHGFAYEQYRDHFRNSEFSRQQFSLIYSRHAVLGALKAHLKHFEDEHRLVQVPHHLAHAASAYFLSGFDEALILVVDGMGELHSVSLYSGSGGKLELLRQLPALHSLGILYSVFTLYLGFVPGFDEYKVMGLAPYGNRRRHFGRMMALVQLQEKGGFTIPALFENRNALENETYAGTIRRLVEEFGPARQSGTEITQRHKDVAAALQACIEATLMHVLRHFRWQTQLENLCLAGGVALNCSANGVILRSRLFKKLFVQPAAGDDGTALGAALQVSSRAQYPNCRPSEMGLPFWGPSYDRKLVEPMLEGRADLAYQRYGTFAALTEEIARRLAQGEVVAWFQGSMEFGPRALGNRSILADPRDESMRDRINKIIKKREDFRPFAPAVVSEEATRYFEIPEGQQDAFRCMLIVARVRDRYLSQLPAVTHVDASARVQTVSEAQHPNFWALLKAFQRITGIPILLNTSFNLRGQPIVRSPSEALDTFRKTDIDTLVIEEFVITRRQAVAVKREWTSRAPAPVLADE